MTCTFCDIIEEHSMGYIIYQDLETTAFLDRSPVVKGHVLVVPNAHILEITKCDPQTLGSLMVVVKKVAQCQRAALKASGNLIFNNNVIGQSVAHLHFHVVPRSNHDGYRASSSPSLKYESQQQMQYYREILGASI
ncbi:HIT family protein [Acidithrix sp. C25]|uniref:HIT family protein n=1 Tax=Acidithrix sp. C25 TaxID=1671482 RepID=UPI00191BAC4D|nr:HIT family protein [Acidithrix sp. C25]